MYVCVIHKQVTKECKLNDKKKVPKNENKNENIVSMCVYACVVIHKQAEKGM